MEGVVNILNGVEYGCQVHVEGPSILEGVVSIWNGVEHGAKYM